MKRSPGSARRSCGRCAKAQPRPGPTSFSSGETPANRANGSSASWGAACTRKERLGRLKLAIDCANGATTTVAPRLFRDLEYDVTVLGAQPDGRNINLDCGSTHPERLAAAVREGGHRVGVAFDGDGDRAIFVD